MCMCATKKGYPILLKLLLLLVSPLLLYKTLLPRHFVQKVGLILIQAFYHVLCGKKSAQLAILRLTDVLLSVRSHSNSKCSMLLAIMAFLNWPCDALCGYYMDQAICP